MNILNIAEMVGDLLIMQVEHAVVAVQRINEYLPEELRFKTETTGDELMHAFADLPQELQEPLKTQVILTDDEVDAFVDCVTRLRDVVREQVEEFDDTAGSVGGFASVAFTFAALAYVLIYVFQSVVDGDSVSGVMHDMLVHLHQQFHELISALPPK
jgi:hypothetical protein